MSRHGTEVGLLVDLSVTVELVQFFGRSMARRVFAGESRGVNNSIDALNGDLINTLIALVISLFDICREFPAVDVYKVSDYNNCG